MDVLFILVVAVSPITGNVIPAWDIAISTMKTGELSRILVRPEYAFGKHGCPPRVPTDATSKLQGNVMSVYITNGLWFLSAV